MTHLLIGKLFMRQIVPLIFLFFALANTATAADFVVIVHPAATIETLTIQQARDIYFGYKRSWKGGVAITPLAQKDRELTADFCEGMMGVTLQQYFLHWRKAIFTGQGTPPMEVADDAEMKKFVALNPGAIGYIHRSALDRSIKELPLR